MFMRRLIGFSQKPSLGRKPTLIMKIGFSKGYNCPMKPGHFPKRQEALKIIEELNLIEFLNTIGQVHLVGSVALNLIVKPDIDLHLLLDHPNLMDTSSAITAYLLDQPKIREIRVTDWRDKGGIKLGVDRYPGENAVWSLDIWITNREETGGMAVIEEFSKLLTPKKSEIILEIKSYFHHQDLLRDGLSLKIYTAVLKDGVKTIGEFKTWQS